MPPTNTTFTYDVNQSMIVPWDEIIEDMRVIYLRFPETLKCVDGALPAFRKVYQKMIIAGNFERNRLQEALNSRDVNGNARNSIIAIHQLFFPDKWDK